MSLTVERRIEELLSDAERRGSCCVPGDRATRAAMRRRAGEVTEPIRGIFVRGEVWERLEPPDKMMHLMRAIAALRPTWRFCGASAAVAYGLPVTWELLDEVSVAAPPGAVHQATGGIVRHHIADDAVECV